VEAHDDWEKIGIVNTISPMESRRGDASKSRSNLAIFLEKGY